MTRARPIALFALATAACYAGGAGVDDDTGSTSPPATTSGDEVSTAGADPGGSDGAATGNDPSGGDGADTAGADSSDDGGMPPVVGGCDGNRFAFGVFSDNYEGQEGGLGRIFAEMAAVEDMQFFVGAGDTPTFQRVREVADATLGTDGPCGATEWPWLPSTGNHDVEDPANMAWWAAEYANGWDDAPADSRLAQQLPGLTNFQRGPVAVATPGGSMPVAPGTIFSFDYKHAHFVFVHDYEREGDSDADAGVWDDNGADDATSSQLDWLRADLEANTQPVTFVIGHVALHAPCYVDDACPDSPEPPGWSEHNSHFHHDELAALLVEHGVVAFFHGHDHVASRMLVDDAAQSVYERLFWDVVNDPAPDPAQWEGLQGPGRVWQVDAGRVYTPSGNYVVVVVTPYDVTIEIRAYAEDGETVTWDSFTVPVGVG